MLILELNPFREDLGPPEGKGGGAEHRAATPLWELASGGIPLSSNSRKIAPGAEIPRGVCRFLML